MREKPREKARTDPAELTDRSDHRSDPSDPPDPSELLDQLTELPITYVLDLHSCQPAEVPDLVRDYLDAAYEKGLRQLRIIHGKGIGVQRQTVRTLLERDPRVEAFGDAPLEAGSWGATWVQLR